MAWGREPALLESTDRCNILFVFDMCRDITNMYKEPPPGLHIAADEDDITKVCAQSFNGIRNFKVLTIGQVHVSTEYQLIHVYVY